MASGTKATRLTLDGHSLVVISCSTRAKGSPTRDDAALWSDILWSSIDTLLLSHSSLPLLHQLFLGTLRGFTGTVLAPEPLLSYWALDTLESGDMSQRDVKRALRMCKCVGFYQELVRFHRMYRDQPIDGRVNM